MLGGYSTSRRRVSRRRCRPFRARFRLKTGSEIRGYRLASRAEAPETNGGFANPPSESKNPEMRIPGFRRQLACGGIQLRGAAFSTSPPVAGGILPQKVARNSGVQVGQQGPMFRGISPHNPTDFGLTRGFAVLSRKMREIRRLGFGRENEGGKHIFAAPRFPTSVSPGSGSSSGKNGVRNLGFQLGQRRPRLQW